MLGMITGLWSAPSVAVVKLFRVQRNTGAGLIGRKEVRKTGKRTMAKTSKSVTIRLACCTTQGVR